MVFLIRKIFTKRNKISFLIIIVFFFSIGPQGQIISFPEVSGWQWTSTDVVSINSTGDSCCSILTIDGDDNAHVMWSDGTDYASSGTDVDIFYQYRNATIGNWSTTEVISTESTGISRFPSMGIDSQNNIHVVWEDSTDYAGSGSGYDIFYKYKNATTGIWNTTAVVSTESTINSFEPKLAIDKTDNIHVVWEDNTNYLSSGTDFDIIYKYLNASTASWSTAEVVSTGSTGTSQDSSLAIDSQNNVHILWDDVTDYAGSGTDTDIFYRYRNATTGSWSTTEVVSSESTGGSAVPSPAIDNLDNIHVAWYDSTDYASSGTDFDIFYKYWNATTTSWSTVEVVSTESTANSFFPNLVIDSQYNVHIAWEDLTDYEKSGTERDIFYKHFNATTTSWSTTQVVSTESYGNSHFVRLGIDSYDNVHFTWHDYTNYENSGTDRDIFYKIAFYLDNFPQTITDTTTTTVTDTTTVLNPDPETRITTQIETSVITEQGATKTLVITETETTIESTTETTPLKIVPIFIILFLVNLIHRKRK